MKRIFLCILACCCLPLYGQVSVLSVVNEDAHSKKEDFWHTFEYYILPLKGPAQKCQATRVGKKWFATAAHCVTVCKDGCELRVDLLEQPFSALASVRHTPKKPLVFVHPQYGAHRSVVHDFALLKIDLNQAAITYYQRPQEPGSRPAAVSAAQFDAFLRRTPSARREFIQALNPALPPLLVFEEATRRIDRTLSVISIFDGKRAVLQNPHPSYYVKELGFAYTQNFGVREGMSGSGVMTNTGELAGIISGSLTIGSRDKKDEFFTFAVFNKQLTEFMENVMGSDYYKMDRKDAYPHYVVRSKEDHRPVVDAWKSLSRPKRGQNKRSS